MLIQTSELTDYIDPQGVKYSFNVPAAIGKWVLSESGYGTPPIEYVTQRGAQQHGDTVVGIWLRPRVVQLLIRANWCSREAYWLGRGGKAAPLRQGLLNSIRPNRQFSLGGTQPGILRKTLPDGTQRSLSVFITEGPRFEPDQIGRWDQWSYQEVLRFTAYDPVWFDPTETRLTFTNTQTELEFPITFPITFGSFDVTTNAITPGTWQTYPAIQIYGPITAPLVENLSTGQRIQLLTTLAAGEYVVIELSYGNKSVRRFPGNTNAIGTLSTDSDLADFGLYPDPIVAGGYNSIHVSGSGANVNTHVLMTWHDRYWAI